MLFIARCFGKPPAVETSRASVDIIVFSADRPLQLYAFLESLYQHITGLGKVMVLTRANNNEYKKAYDKVQQAFPQTLFTYEDTNQDSFKNNLISLMQEQATGRYLMFAVDDLVVIRSCDLNDCIRALDQQDHYAFYLRMGKNITRHYGLKPGKTMSLPALVPFILSPSSKNAIYEWGLVPEIKDFFNPWYYPFSLDMTIFRKNLVIDLIMNWLSYTNPGLLEYRWAKVVQLLPGKKGLCFELSTVVNLPLNLVHATGEKNMNYLSTQELLVKFNEGLKIDVQALFNIDHNSPHEDISPNFIQRL